MNATQSAGRKRRGRDIDGILLLDKPVGISSNEALQRAKRIFQARKAGHTGSLDVLASGLLPLCFGEATKLSQFLLEADKRYVVELVLGRRTSTGDSEGETLSLRPTDAITRAALEQAMHGFLGPIAQVPPMYSALKRHGQPLYKLARQGIEVEREKRDVLIHAFRLVEYGNPRSLVEVVCSKGTYVRTLVEDLGEHLDCGAFVSSLRRQGAGPFELEHAWTLEQLHDFALEGPARLDQCLLPLDSALGHLAAVRLDDAQAQRLRSGQSVQVETTLAAAEVRLYDALGLLGIGEVLASGGIAPRRMMRAQASETKGESQGRDA